MATEPGHDPVRKEYGALASEYDRKWAGYVEAAIRETLRRMPGIPPGRGLPIDRYRKIQNHLALGPDDRDGGKGKVRLNEGPTADSASALAARG